mgnify:CR=1 FL=1
MPYRPRGGAVSDDQPVSAGNIAKVIGALGIGAEHGRVDLGTVSLGSMPNGNSTVVVSPPDGALLSDYDLARFSYIRKRGGNFTGETCPVFFLNESLIPNGMERFFFVTVFDAGASSASVSGRFNDGSVYISDTEITIDSKRSGVNCVLGVAEFVKLPSPAA